METIRLTDLGLGNADLTAIGKLSETSLTPQQIADAVLKSHNLVPSTGAAMVGQWMNVNFPLIKQETGKADKTALDTHMKLIDLYPPATTFNTAAYPKAKVAWSTESASNVGTTGTLPATANWQSIAWNGTVFCAAAYGTSTAVVSRDGITWYAFTMSASNNWVSVASNGTSFVSLSNSTMSSRDIVTIGYPATALTPASPVAETTDTKYYIKMG